MHLKMFANLSISFVIALQPLLCLQATAAGNFKIHIEQPAYTDRPIWIRADLMPPLTVRYPAPYSDGGHHCWYPYVPNQIGENLIEVKLGSKILKPRIINEHFGGVVTGAAIHDQDGDPKNRLPLHLLYSFSEPGKYSVRWNRTKEPEITAGNLKALDSRPIVTQSQWLTIDVRQSNHKDRENWLRKTLSNPPKDPALVVGELLELIRKQGP